MPYEIILRDRTSEFVNDADAFTHEKAMTTFYRTANARQSVDCWSVPVASVRTDEILMIREQEPQAAQALRSATCLSTPVQNRHLTRASSSSALAPQG
jgi:hypothetical protein